MAGEANEVKWVGTRKVDPAIADLQAIEDFVRVFDLHVATGAAEIRDLYTVPAGKVYTNQFVSGYAYTGNPSTFLMSIRSGGTSYNWAIISYGAAFSIVADSTPVTFNAGEIVRVTWGGCTVGDTLASTCGGILIDQY